MQDRVSEEDTVMELTGKLKEQVEKAETKDEKKRLIENVGILLNEEELDQVSGGKLGVELGTHIKMA